MVGSLLVLALKSVLCLFLLCVTSAQRGGQSWAHGLMAELEVKGCKSLLSGDVSYRPVWLAECHAQTCCVTNSSLRWRAWLVTAMCEAHLTKSPISMVRGSREGPRRTCQQDGGEGARLVPHG